MERIKDCLLVNNFARLTKKRSKGKNEAFHIKGRSKGCDRFLVTKMAKIVTVFNEN